MITYLAIPYSFNPELSFEIANEVAAKLMLAGKIVFSPVSHSHKIAEHLPEPERSSHNFWMCEDLPILDVCGELLVVVIGEIGHQLIAESKGCCDEIERSMIRQIPIKYYQYDFKKE